LDTGAGMNNDISDEKFIREASIKALSKMLKKFHPEDFDIIYIKALGLYNKHYAPYAKANNFKSDWYKMEQTT
jgi:hypothetical protein